MGSAFTDYTQTLLLAWPIKPFGFFFQFRKDMDDLLDLHDYRLFELMWLRRKTGLHSIR